MLRRKVSPNTKSSLSGPDPALRWFGKLPTYGDYYSSSTDGDWTVEFHNWLLEGFVAYRSRIAATGIRSSGVSRSSWIVRLPKSNVTVLSSIADYGGDSQGRAFPLCFYVGLPTPSWPGPTGDTVLGAMGVLGRLADAHTEVDRLLASSQEVEPVFSPRGIDVAAVSAAVVDDSWRKDASATPMNQWFAGAAELLQAKDQKTWGRALMRWGQAIGALGPDAHGVTLRLPLSNAAVIDAQVAGWLRWLASYMDLASRQVSLAVVVDPPHHAGYLAVVVRPIMPEDFLLVTPAHDTLSYVDDACRLGAGEDSAASVTCCDGADRWLDLVEGRLGGS